LIAAQIMAIQAAARLSAGSSAPMLPEAEFRTKAQPLAPLLAAWPETISVTAFKPVKAAAHITVIKVMARNMAARITDTAYRMAALMVTRKAHVTAMPAHLAADHIP